MTSLPKLHASELPEAAEAGMTIPSMLGAPVSAWVDAVSRLGPFIELVSDTESVVVMASAEANKISWSTPDLWSYSQTDAANVFHSQLGPEHVSALDGEAHRRLRKLLLPAFGVAALKRDIETSADVMTRGVTQWRGQSVELHGAACHLFTKALTRSQVHVETDDALIGELCEFEENFIAGVQISAAEQKPWFARERYQALRTKAFAFFNDVLDDHLVKRPPNDSLTLLLERTPPEGMASLTREELLHATYLLSIAGVGNIANLLCGLLWSIHDTPWLAKLRGELDGFDLTTLSGMKKLPILSAVIKEAERMFLPAPVVPKRTERDVEILGQKLPAGTLVQHMHGLAHFDPGRYPNPLQFDPSRWLGEGTERANAFGGGKHLCLGMGVTRAYLPLATALLVREDLTFGNAPIFEPLDPAHAPRPVTTTLNTQIS